METDRPGSLADLNARLAARVTEMEKLIGGVAHQLGATMLPSLKGRPDAQDQRAWNRIMFQAGAMKEHIVGQKRALDFLRGSRRGDMDALDSAVWLEWIAPLLEGLIAHNESPRLTFDLDGPVSLPFSRAIVLLVMALDQQAARPCSIEFSQANDIGIAQIRMDDESRAEWIAIPAVLREAWQAAGSFGVLRSDTAVTLRVELAP